MRRTRTLTAVASKPDAYTGSAGSIRRTTRSAAQSTLGCGPLWALLSPNPDRSVMPRGHARNPRSETGFDGGVAAHSVQHPRGSRDVRGLPSLMPLGRVCVPSTRIHRRPSNRLSALSLYGEQFPHRVASASPQHPSICREQGRQHPQALLLAAEDARVLCNKPCVHLIILSASSAYSHLLLGRGMFCMHVPLL